MPNRQELGRRGSWPNLGYHPDIYLDRLVQNTRKSAKIQMGYYYYTGLQSATVLLSEFPSREALGGLQPSCRGKAAGKGIWHPRPLCPSYRLARKQLHLTFYCLLHQSPRLPAVNVISHCSIRKNLSLDHFLSHILGISKTCSLIFFWRGLLVPSMIKSPRFSQTRRLSNENIVCNSGFFNMACTSSHVSSFHDLINAWE
jgi:hypothetical protein